MEPRMCEEAFIDTLNLFDETGGTISKGAGGWLYGSGPDWFDDQMMMDNTAIPTFELLQHKDALGEECTMKKYCERFRTDDGPFCHCVRHIDKDFPLVLTKYTRYEVPNLTKEDPIWNFEIHDFAFLVTSRIVDPAVQEALEYANESVKLSLYMGSLTSDDLSRPFFINSAKYKLMRKYNPNINFEKIKDELYTIRFHSVTPERDWRSGCAFPFLYMATDSIGQIVIFNPQVLNIPGFRVYEPKFIDVDYQKRDASINDAIERIKKMEEEFRRMGL